jgi:hypothetical protein
MKSPCLMVKSPFLMARSAFQNPHLGVGNHWLKGHAKEFLPQFCPWCHTILLLRYLGIPRGYKLYQVISNQLVESGEKKRISTCFFVRTFEKKYLVLPPCDALLVRFWPASPVHFHPDAHRLGLKKSMALLKNIP